MQGGSGLSLLSTARCSCEGRPRMPVMVKEADLNRVEVPGDYEILDATEDHDVVQWTLL
jgi:hypothetical protein